MGFRKKALDFPETKIKLPKDFGLGEVYDGKTLKVLVEKNQLYINGEAVNRSAPVAKYLKEILQLPF